jgi:hypothetical protein
MIDDFFCKIIIDDSCFLISFFPQEDEPESIVVEDTVQEMVVEMITHHRSGKNNKSGDLQR